MPDMLYTKLAASTHPRSNSALDPWGGAMLAREQPEAEEPPPAEGWRRIHEALTALAARRSELDAEEAPWLVEGLRCRVFAQFGHASFIEYLESVFGYSPRVARERVRVAEALAELPGLSSDLRSGELAWTAVRELTRVATAETEDVWREAVRGLTLREIEQKVAGRERGSLPTDPASREAIRRRLSFDVSAETYALMQEALDHLRRTAGGPLSEEQAIQLMARKALGADSDASEPAHQVHLQMCPECGEGTQKAGGDDVVVDSTVLEQAGCDARWVQAGQRSRASIPPATRREVVARDRGRCQVPGCRHHTFVDVHHIRSRSDGGTHDPSNLIVLCTAHHTAVHRGYLRLEGRAGADLRFLHVDGTDYRRTAPDPAALQAVSDAVLALVRLGFPKSVAVSAAQKSATHVGRGAGAEGILLRALRDLTGRLGTVVQPPTNSGG